MEDLSEDINIIKSLIAIAKGGLPVSRICSEYYEMTNNRLNFAKYGFRSIQDMLKSSSEIVFKQTCDGPVCSVNDAKISHVTALVEKTRSKKKKSRGKRHFCYPGRSSNYVPSRNLSVLYRGQGQFRNNSKNLSLQFRGQTQSYNNSKNVSLPSKKQSQSYNYSKNASLQYKGQTQSCNNSRANYYQAKQPCQLRDRPQLQYLSNNSLQLQGPRPVINIPAKSINKDPHSSKSNQVQSSSDDGWSSSCSDWSEEPLSDQECKQKRSAEVIRDCISNNTNVVSSLRITVPNSRNSSGSDWSDSDEVSLTGQTQGEKLEFSVEGNPTRFQTLGISRLNPLTRTLNSSQGVNLGDRPLMGGVGRGSSRRLASFKSDRIEPLLPVNGGIIVSGSPAKREVVAANSSITIRLPNSAYNNSCQSFKEIDSWGPSYQNFRFVGDMYLLRVAQICLGFQERVQKSESACGLCRNNLTISDCEKEIAKIGAPPMIILMIGMADILKEATIEDMQRATVSLLQRLKKHQVVLISLPTPPSFLKSGNLGKLSVLEKFNKWLLALDFPVKIDINKHLHCDRLYYERDPNSAVETFSEGGSWIVMHEIVSVLLQCEEWKLTAKTN